MRTLLRACDGRAPGAGLGGVFERRPRAAVEHVADEGRRGEDRSRRHLFHGDRIE